MYYFYVIKNEIQELYYGYTNDLKKRLFDYHNKGKSFSTKNHKWKLVYYEAYLSQEDAKEREEQIKQFGQAWAQLRRRIKKSLNES
ncbi:MAG: GIY-YIG nuclease family protein [Candidatus Moraniibacteriota bacterium]